MAQLKETIINGALTTLGGEILEQGISLANKYAFKVHTHTYVPISDSTLNFVSSTGIINSQGSIEFVADATKSVKIAFNSLDTTHASSGLVISNTVSNTSGTNPYLWVKGSIYANDGFKGNADTSTTLLTSRLINGVAFNGSANITIADSTKLALAGGFLTGAVTIKGAATSLPLNVQNIVGTNDAGLASSDLYLQYGVNKKLRLGNTGVYTISEDGSQYSGNSSTTTKLATGRNITLTGDLSGFATFDGSQNVSIASTITKAIDAVTVKSYAPTLDVNNTTSNALVKTDANGSIIASSVIYNSIAIDADAINHVLYTSSTGAVHKATPSYLKTQLNLNNVSNIIDSNKVVASAGKLTTARTISISGDITGSVLFNGTQDVNISATYAINTFVPIAGGTMSGDLIAKKVIAQGGKYTSTVASRYLNSGIEIRENALVANLQSDIGYAPSLGFNWLGVAGGQLALAADTTFKLLKQDGTIATLYANTVGNSSTATKLETSRLITIYGGASGSVWFDGSANASIHVTDIAAHAIAGTIYNSSLEPSIVTEIARLSPFINAQGCIKITFPAIPMDYTSVKMALRVEGRIGLKLFSIYIGARYDSPSWRPDITAERITLNNCGITSVSVGNDGTHICIILNPLTKRYNYDLIMVKSMTGSDTGEGATYSGATCEVISTLDGIIIDHTENIAVPSTINADGYVPLAEAATRLENSRSIILAGEVECDIVSDDGSTDISFYPHLRPLMLVSWDNNRVTSLDIHPGGWNDNNCLKYNIVTDTASSDSGYIGDGYLITMLWDNSDVDRYDGQLFMSNSQDSPNISFRTKEGTNIWGDWTTVANIESPTFTGIPSAPTAETGTTTTQLATTEFVANAIISNSGADWSQLTNIPSSFTPSAHVQAISTITGLQTALDLKSNISSPVFTGLPKGPTAATGTTTTQLATTEFVANTILNLIDASPGALNTLNELAAALGDDPNFATTMTTNLGTKLNNTEVVTVATANKILRLDSNSKLPASITGNAATATNVSWYGVTDKPSTYAPSAHTHSHTDITGLSTVATSGSYADLSNKPTSMTANGGASDTAIKLLTARTIALTGGITSSATFDGSANIALNVTGVATSVLQGIVSYTNLPSDISTQELTFIDITSSSTGAVLVQFPFKQNSNTIALQLKIIKDRLTDPKVFTIEIVGNIGTSSKIWTVSDSGVRQLSEGDCGFEDVSFGTYGSNAFILLGTRYTIFNDINISINGITDKQTIDGIAYTGILCRALSATETSTYSSYVDVSKKVKRIAGIDVSGTIPLSSKAVILETARTIALSGGVTGSITFDGSSDVSIVSTVADDSHIHSTSTITGLATVATSGSYTDLSDKPTSLLANGGNSTTVNGHTVLTDVPVNALFTDTVYVHPATHPVAMITGLATVATSGSYTDLSDKPVLYSLPIATDTLLGGIKVGNGLITTNGVLSTITPTTIINLNTNTELGFWKGTSTEYGLLGMYSDDIAYFITDENVLDDIESGYVTIGDGLVMNNGVLSATATGNGTLTEIPIATDVLLGGIKVGSGLTITDGVLSTPTYNGIYSSIESIIGEGYTPVNSIPTASATTLGGIKVGSGLTITDGILDVIDDESIPYVLPVATASVSGGIKIGEGLTITDGVVSVPELAGVNDALIAILGV